MKKPTFTIAYSTVFWNHYQAAICREMAHLLGPDRFKMCVMQPLDEERRALKWEATPPKCEWIIPPPENQDELDRISQIMCNADVAVMGTLVVELPWYNKRLRNGKLTFRSAERLLKISVWRRLLNPRFLGWLWKYRNSTRPRSLHHLAIGAYAACDARFLGLYGRRHWTWAYFAELSSEAPKPRGKRRLRILWVGRLVDWKRVDMLVVASKRLRDVGVLEQLDIVGNGPELASLRKLAATLGVEDVCQFHDPISPSEVLAHMRRSDVYALPSTRAEGWGVVANEALSEGCILVANRQAGSAPMLIRNGETGFMHENGNVHQFVRIIESLAADPVLQDRIRVDAWESIQRLWHPRVAAQRFVALCEGLLGIGVMPHYPEGPCSPA